MASDCSSCRGAVATAGQRSCSQRQRFGFVEIENNDEFLDDGLCRNTLIALPATHRSGRTFDGGGELAHRHAPGESGLPNGLSKGSAISHVARISRDHDCTPSCGRSPRYRGVSSQPGGNVGTEYKNLVELYESSVSRFADNPLFGTKQADSWSWMSYRDFGEQVDFARAGLAGLGLERGDRVAAISDNRTEWAIGAYATYGLGASWVPMYEAQLSKEWEFIIGDSGAKIAVVADDGIRAQLEDHHDQLPALEQVIVINGEAGGDAITWAELLARGAEAPVDTVHPDSGDVAGLIYTSGTTGSPKGVMLVTRQHHQQRQCVP